MLLYSIDAEGGKKLQDFSKILRKFYKNVQKLHFCKKKGRPNEGRPSKGVSSQNLASRPTGRTICHKIVLAARLRIPFL